MVWYTERPMHMHPEARGWAWPHTNLFADSRNACSLLASYARHVPFVTCTATFSGHARLETRAFIPACRHPRLRNRQTARCASPVHGARGRPPRAQSFSSTSKTIMRPRSACAEPGRSRERRGQKRGCSAQLSCRRPEGGAHKSLYEGTSLG